VGQCVALQVLVWVKLRESLMPGKNIPGRL
jgi:hypothetical protein